MKSPLKQNCVPKNNRGKNKSDTLKKTENPKEAVKLRSQRGRHENEKIKNKWVLKKT